MLDRTFSRVATCVFMALTFIPMTAEAPVGSVTVNTTRDYEGADGYRDAEITIHGSVARGDGSAGLYSVPAVVIHPRDGRGKGVGIHLCSSLARSRRLPTTSSSIATLRDTVWRLHIVAVAF